MLQKLVKLWPFGLPVVCECLKYILMHSFFFTGTEPPDSAIEHAGVIALQAQEIQVDHSVSIQ